MRLSFAEKNMKPFFISILAAALPLVVLSAQSPQEAPLPGPLRALEATLVASHFPSPVYATTDDGRTDYRYFWKHNTSVMSPVEEVQVEECGAYIFYNEQWNLRVRYGVEDFASLFNCPKGKMKRSQPYTFTDNWRTDNRLLGGWALWYFIGTTASGKRVCGYARLETVGRLYGEQDGE